MMSAGGRAQEPPALTRSVALFQERVLKELETLVPEMAYLETIGIITPDTPPVEVVRAVAEARQSEALEQIAAIVELLLEQQTLGPALCPALRRCSDEPFEVAKRITPALLSLVIAGQVIAVPPEPLLFATVALVIARMGVRQFCLHAGATSAEPPAQLVGSTEAKSEAQKLLSELLNSRAGASEQHAGQAAAKRARRGAAVRLLLAGLGLVVALGGLALFFPGLASMSWLSDTPAQDVRAPLDPTMPAASPQPTALPSLEPTVPPSPQPTAPPSPQPPTPDSAVATAATPTATPANCGRGIVSGTGPLGLNVRQAPALDAAIVVALLEGSAVTTCETQASGGIAWVKVQAQLPDGTVEGWASVGFIQPEAPPGP